MVPLDRNTGENNVDALLRQEARIPGLKCFQDQFPLTIRMTTADRAGANIRAEQHMKAINPQQTVLQYPCDVHKKASCLKSALRVVDDVVSGTVNVGLSMEPIGSLATLRTMLQEIFMEHLQIIFDEPPGGEVARHQHALLDLCLPEGSGTGGVSWKTKKRRMILKYFANSDLQKTEIVHFCGFGCCKSPEDTMQHFVSEVTWALLPRKMGVLKRKSWIGCDAQFSWLALLSGFWNLHQLLLIKFTGYVQKPVQRMETETTSLLAAFQGDSANMEDVDMEELKAWRDLANGMFSGTSNDRGENEGLEPNPHDEVGQTLASDQLEGQSWADFNRGVKLRAGAFLSCEKFWDQLMVTCMCVRPGLRLLHFALHLASKDFDEEQESNVMQDKVMNFRVLEAALGTSIAQCFSDIQDILAKPPPVLPFSSYTRYCRSLSFRILSGQACSVELLLRRSHRGFPYALFLLLETHRPDLLEHVYSLPACYHDDLSKRFFQQFPTPDSARDPTAQALLTALSQLSELDISNIENGHASVREFTMLRGRGHAPNIAHVAARCLCRWIGKAYGYLRPKKQHMETVPAVPVKPVVINVIKWVVMVQSGRERVVVGHGELLSQRKLPT